MEMVVCCGREKCKITRLLVIPELRPIRTTNYLQLTGALSGICGLNTCKQLYKVVHTTIALIYKYPQIPDKAAADYK